jgi:V8-like Glu-specific endopeptidase
MSPLVLLALAACQPPPSVSAPDAPYDLAPDQKSICGSTEDYIEVEDADAPYQEWAPAAAMSVDNRGTSTPTDDDDWCSGALIAPNLFITANHCALSCSRTDVWFNYQLTGGVLDPTGVDAYSCIEDVDSNGRLTDFLIIRLEGSPGDLYGYFEMDVRAPVSGEDMVIIGHPGSTRPKKVSLGFTGSSGTSWFYYQADTEGGSSGSPVLSADGLYLGTHTNGGCNGRDPERGYNYGRRIDYTYSISPFLQDHRYFDQRTSDAPEGEDRFGAALATGDFDCDGLPDLAVGAPGQSGGAGAVTVRYGSLVGLAASGELWLESPYAAAGEDFGAALAAGDFNGDGCSDLAIGLPGADSDGADDAGAVEIAWGGAGGLSEPSERLDADDFGGRFYVGASLGAALVAADLDGDGLDDLAAGAPGDALSAGALAIAAGGESLTPSLWLDEDDLGAGSRGDGDRFGAALAAGDFDADGDAELLVAAPGERTGPGLDGAGQVTLIDGEVWSKWGGAVTLMTQDGGAGEQGDSFGEALAVGDFNGDGLLDAAFGAPGERATAAGNGQVSLRYGDVGGLTGAWVSFDFSRVAAPRPYDRFGAALTAGDFDGDGLTDLAIAAPGAAVDRQRSAGRVVVRYGDGVGLTDPVEIDQTKVSGASADDAFGGALAAGDFNGDGDDDLAVGAPGQALYGEPDAGAVILDAAE